MTEAGNTNLPQVEQFIEYLGGIEDQVFKNRLERDTKRKLEMQDVRGKDEIGDLS